MPSMGEAMIVCARLTCACLSEALACSTCASAERSAASAWRVLTSAASRSDADSSWRADSSCARRSFTLASSSSTRARSASASRRTTVARACSTCVSKSDEIELGDDLAAADVCVEVGPQRFDRAGDLRADLHRRHGLQLAGGVHLLDDVSTRHGGGGQRRAGGCTLRSGTYQTAVAATAASAMLTAYQRRRRPDAAPSMGISSNLQPGYQEQGGCRRTRGDAAHLAVGRGFRGWAAARLVNFQCRARNVPKGGHTA